MQAIWGEGFFSTFVISGPSLEYSARLELRIWNGVRWSNQSSSVCKWLHGAEGCELSGCMVWGVKRIHGEQGYFSLKPVYSLHKCCESVTRWLLGASEREGANRHDCDVLALPLPARAKKFKWIRLHQARFECTHYLWVSLPLNLHSWNDKIPFQIFLPKSQK